MSPFDFKQHLTELLADAVKAVAPEAADTAFVVERPKDARHGDYATNLAMQLARPLRQNPRALAEKLIAELRAKGYDVATRVTAATTFWPARRLAPARPPRSPCPCCTAWP